MLCRGHKDHKVSPVSARTDPPYAVIVNEMSQLFLDWSRQGNLVSYAIYRLNCVLHGYENSCCSTTLLIVSLSDSHVLASLDSAKWYEIMILTHIIRNC